MSHATTAARPAATAEAEPEARQSWTVLGLMLAAQFMVILDISVVNVALPSIGKALQFTTTDYQWTVSAYVLLSGGLLLFGGRLADLLDRRAMFLTGLGLFTVASLVSATATSATMMIVSRAAQGAGAALLTPAAMSIVMTSYAGRQRATALAVWGTIGSMGIAVGVLFGGILTTTLGWQAIFFINIPIGVITAIATLRTVTAGQRTGSLRGVDLPGAATAVGGLLALVYAIEGTRTHGWTAPQTILGFAAAAVLLTAFSIVERRVAAPLVPPATWRIRSLVSASTVMAVITGGVVGAIFISSLFLQSVLGSSAVMTGVQFLPLAAAITMAAMAASKLLGRVAPKTMMVVGLLIVSAGSVLLAGIGDDPSYWAGVLPGFVVIGLGVGPMFVAISVAAMTGIPQEKSGLASGLMMTGHEVGAAVGVASLAAIAGDLTTRTGLIDAYPRVFLAVSVAMVVLAGFAALAVPRQPAQTDASTHGH
ncbi:MAG TPA: MFS transporter [Candidatus Limnocylindria bacterium]|nr:MFS transporter [Candidatus Limnocylindria bacterium]